MKDKGQYIVCHLGAHKTATSLIQKYFKATQTDYKKRGLLFYTRGEISPFIRWGEPIVSEGEELRKYIDQGFANRGIKIIGFSNENALGRPIIPNRDMLYPNHRKYMEALKSALDGYPIKFAYYIRPQHEYIQSYYLQMVHQGKYMTFQQYLSDIDIGKISWRPLLDSAREVFGAENVYLGDFAAIRNGQNTFLKSFMDTLMPGMAEKKIDYQFRHNSSVSDRGLHMALRINPLLEKPRERRLVRRFLQENFSNATGPRPVLMTHELTNELKQRYDEENAALLAEGLPIV